MSSFVYVFLNFLPVSCGKQMTATFARPIPLHNLFNIILATDQLNAQILVL